MASSTICVNSVVVRQQIRIMRLLLAFSKTSFPTIKNNQGETAERLKEAFKICKKLESDFRKLILDTASILTSSLAAFEGADSSLAGLFQSSLPGIESVIGTVSVQNPSGVIGIAQSIFAKGSLTGPAIGTIGKHLIQPGAAVVPNWANAIFSATNGIGVTLSSIASAIGHVDVQVGELIDPHIHLSTDLLEFFETHTFDVESFIGDSDAHLEPAPIPKWLVIIPGIRRHLIDVLRKMDLTDQHVQTSATTTPAQSDMSIRMPDPWINVKDAVSVVTEIAQNDWRPWFDDSDIISAASLVLNVKMKEPILYSSVGHTAGGLQVGSGIPSDTDTARVIVGASNMTAARAAALVMRSPQYACGMLGTRLSLDVA